MQKIRFFLFFVIVGFIACESNNLKKSRQILQPIKVLKIPLDSMTSSVWLCIESFSNQDGDFVVYQDKIKTNPDFIDFYCINDSSKSFKVPYEKEGSHGIGSLDGFHVHTLDSIFVINRYKYSVYLTDSRGKIKKSYLLIKEDKPGKNTSLPWVSTSSKMFVWQDTLYIPAFPDVGPPRNDYRKKQLIIALNLNTGVFKYKTSYPKEYNKVFWGYDHTQISTAWNKTNECVVINYPVSHSLFVEDLKSGKMTEKKLAPSKLLNTLKPLDKYSDDFEDYTRLQLSNDKYYSIDYDPFRDVYYRFCIEHYDEESIDKILNSEVANNIPQKSVMILNSRFELLSEVLLPKNDYTVQYMFIHKEGLYISKKEENDEYKSFQLFTLDTFE